MQGGMGMGRRMGGRMGGGMGGDMGRGSFAMGSPNPSPNGAMNSPAWRLLVSQRAGPLAQLVDSTQRRNLAIGFAILLVLGAGGIMLAVSARKARVLARLQMEFVAGVTHELRTPLAVISSAGQNLADGVAAGDEKVRTYGALIRDHSRRLTETVDQVLRFGGLSSGRTELALEAISVEGLVDQAVEDSSYELTGAGASLTRQVAPGLPLIAANREAMGQCLRNLLINAARHGAGSPVCVRVSRHARHIEIEVQNGGPGIEPRELRRIFEPFRRGRRAIDDQIPGTGLGLALVKKIVEAHRGSVKVSSGPGRTCFRLRLPLMERA
jgi:signal transduction histidine kinase